jgi:hypothetical protein
LAKLPRFAPRKDRQQGRKAIEFMREMYSQSGSFVAGPIRIAFA